MIKNHLPNFHTFDLVKLTGQFFIRIIRSDKFQQKQPGKRAKFLIGIMQPRPRMNTTAILAEQMLNRILFGKDI